MSRLVEIRRMRSNGMAECETCTQFNPDSTRERCRQHADRTGHVVRFVVEDTTTYQRRDAS